MSIRVSFVRRFSPIKVFPRFSPAEKPIQSSLFPLIYNTHTADRLNGAYVVLAHFNWSKRCKRNSVNRKSCLRSFTLHLCFECWWNWSFIEIFISFNTQFRHDTGFEIFCQNWMALVETESNSFSIFFSSLYSILHYDDNNNNNV